DDVRTVSAANAATTARWIAGRRPPGPAPARRERVAAKRSVLVIGAPEAGGITMGLARRYSRRAHEDRGSTSEVTHSRLGQASIGARIRVVEKDAEIHRT